MPQPNRTLAGKKLNLVREEMLREYHRALYALNDARGDAERNPRSFNARLKREKLTAQVGVLARMLGFASPENLKLQLRFHEDNGADTTQEEREAAMNARLYYRAEAGLPIDPHERCVGPCSH